MKVLYKITSDPRLKWLLVAAVIIAFFLIIMVRFAILRQA